MATIGALESAYLTYQKINPAGLDLLCGASGGCLDVLNGPYASVLVRRARDCRCRARFCVERKRQVYRRHPPRSNTCWATFHRLYIYLRRLSVEFHTVKVQRDRGGSTCWKRQTHQREAVTRCFFVPCFINFFCVRHVWRTYDMSVSGVCWSPVHARYVRK